MGVQSQLGVELRRGPRQGPCLIFAINGRHQWSNAAGAEYDIGIDTNGDGATDFLVVALDLGIPDRVFDGVDASFTFDAAGDLIDACYADAPMNGSVIELPALAGDMGITAAAPTFSYTITGFDLGTGTSTRCRAAAKYNAFSPSVSNGQFVSLASGASAKLPLSVKAALQATTPSLGWMVVSLDNPNGAAQAALLPVGKLPKHYPALPIESRPVRFPGRAASIPARIGDRRCRAQAAERGCEPAARSHEVMRAPAASETARPIAAEALT